MQKQVELTIRAMREKSPLVHSITNLVVMQVTANALLAAGASPLMAHAQEEMEDLLGLVSALVLNIGTLDTRLIASMKIAGEAANANQVPIVLDPVGAGASRLRTDTSIHLLGALKPAVLRGNAAEILAVAAGERLGGSKGVDSLNSSAEALGAARLLAEKCSCVVSVSGEEDFITDGKRTLAVSGGSPLMPRVTGMGCSATALTAACLAVSTDPLLGAASAMAMMAEAGEKAGRASSGPGSFLPAFMDELYALDPAGAGARVRVL